MILLCTLALSFLTPLPEAECSALPPGVHLGRPFFQTAPLCSSSCLLFLPHQWFACFVFFLSLPSWMLENVLGSCGNPKNPLSETSRLCRGWARTLPSWCLAELLPIYLGLLPVLVTHPALPSCSSPIPLYRWPCPLYRPCPLRPSGPSRLSFPQGWVCSWIEMPPPAACPERPLEVDAPRRERHFITLPTNATGSLCWLTSTSPGADNETGAPRQSPQTDQIAHKMCCKLNNSVKISGTTWNCVKVQQCYLKIIISLIF